MPPIDEIREEAQRARAEGREVIVVQGLGFVGAAMAAVTAATTDDNDEPRFFVIGVDRADSVGKAKIDAVNAGRPVVNTDDPLLAELTYAGVIEMRSLVATSDYHAYTLADVIVVDLPLDARFSGDGDEMELSLDSFADDLGVVAERMPESALLLIESTVPPGTTEKVILPLFTEAFGRRGLTREPLIAHAYERVMPGPRYVESIRAFWRCFAGASPRASQRARDFLEAIIDVDSFPLTELSSPCASEMAKVLENSYRATNIAFIEEWSRAAEAVGVNLFEVVRAIRSRKGTHDNIRQPGFGVGGYCLPKDGLVGEWGLRSLLEYPGGLAMTRDALRINQRMPLHSLEILRKSFPDGLRGVTIGIAGISYLAGVGDTRNSPAEVFLDAAEAEGAVVLASDPMVNDWSERPSVPVVDLSELISRTDGLVFTVGHQVYSDLEVGDFGSRPLVVLDATGVLGDGLASALRAKGHTVLGVGRGDWNSEANH